MNIEDIGNAGKHIIKACKCTNCHQKFKYDDLHVVAASSVEGLFEVKCENCGSGSLISVLIAPELEIREQNEHRKHKKISTNEVLDMKIFLDKFDGNFKNLFK